LIASSLFSKREEGGVMRERKAKTGMKVDVDRKAPLSSSPIPIGRKERGRAVPRFTWGEGGKEKGRAAPAMFAMLFANDVARRALRNGSYILT
jgi:hypothetical protein